MQDRPGFGDPKSDILFKRIFGDEQSAPPLSTTIELAPLAGPSRAEQEQHERKLIAQQVRQGLLSYYAWEKGFKEAFAEGFRQGFAEGLREGIWAVAELVGIAKTAEREAVLRTQTEAQLRTFLGELKQSRSWQTAAAADAASKRRA